MYIVGGAVRAILLGEQPTDMDYVAVGFTEDELMSEGFTRVGVDFPVFLDPINKNEVALARIDISTGLGHYDFKTITDSVTIEQDLIRRDLTINSMAFDNNKNIIDPYGGQEDLKNKILRHTDEKYFMDDPVRVLRLARFQCRYSNFRIHESTIRLVRQHKEKLKNLTPERIYKEMYKAMETPYPSLYFRTLDFLGVLLYVHPELYLMKQCIQKPVHHAEGDVFNHSMMVLDECCKLTKDIPTRFSALYHDIAKYSSDPLSEGFHKGHDSLPLVSVEVENLKKRYRLPNKIVNSIYSGALFHMRLHKLKDMKSGTIAGLFNTKYFPKTRDDMINLLIVSTADSRGRITIGYEKEEIPASAFMYMFDAIKMYSPKKEIDEYYTKHGCLPKPEHIKQMIHRYRMKAVEAWLIPALNFKPTII